MGNVTVNRIKKLRSVDAKITAWEQSFFGSIFTSHGSVNYPGDILKLYKSLEKSKKDFPVENMMEFGKTLKDILHE